MKKTHFKKLKEETHFEKNWRGEEAEEMEASDILGKIKVGGGDEGISWAEEVEFEILLPKEIEIPCPCLVVNCDHVLEKKKPINVLEKKQPNNVLKKKPANKV